MSGDETVDAREAIANLSPGCKRLVRVLKSHQGCVPFDVLIPAVWEGREVSVLAKHGLHVMVSEINEAGRDTGVAAVLITPAWKYGYCWVPTPP